MPEFPPGSAGGLQPKGAGGAAPPCRLGLIGHGIQRSKSPALHEAEARAQGLTCTYELIDLETLGFGLDHLPQLLKRASDQGFAGLNITHPCKQAVIPLLDELSPEAQSIGAVNTVHFHAGRRIGYNTDAWGFSESFRRGLSGASVAQVVQVGAGGAGAATGFSLLELGARELVIVDLDEVRGRRLAANLARRFADREVRSGRDLATEVAEANGVVNCTPVGMSAHPGSAVPEGLLRPDLWVADIVYTPLETQLLRDAASAGCRTLNGGRMAVFQAARAFEIFTGRVADAERMLRHFSQLVGQSAA
jgi:quinate/shikimate dehydrogenase (NAD+)